jgi:hypothetical protein
MKSNSTPTTEKGINLKHIRDYGLGVCNSIADRDRKSSHGHHGHTVSKSSLRFEYRQRFSFHILRNTDRNAILSSEELTIDLHLHPPYILMLWYLP